MARKRGPPGGGPPRRRRGPYRWPYRCTWADPSGHHVYSVLHFVVTNSSTNYQEASAIARREVLAGLTESERELLALHPDVTFTCRRDGNILDLGSLGA